MHRRPQLPHAVVDHRSPVPTGTGQAGRQAADALLARLPRGLRLLLPRLPSRWAAALLLRWLGRHADALDGAMAVDGRLLPACAAGVHLDVDAEPLARGLPVALEACGLHAAALQHLFACLVHPQARVAAVHCAAGKPGGFDLRWPLS